MDPIFNSVIPTIDSQGTPIPLRWEINDHELIVSAEPAKDEPLATEALAEIEEWQAVLEAMDIPFRTCQRNYPDGPRVDCVRVARWNGTLAKILPLLPMELKPLLTDPS